MKEAIDAVLALSYAREFIRNDDGTWFARVVEFPGCMTEGETPDEAMANLEEAIELWATSKLENGEPIPPPLNAEHYSGKFVVRVPKTLHRALVRRAESENVSLNQYVLSALSRCVGI